MRRISSCCFFAIYTGEFHPVAPILTDHFGADALIGDGVVAIKIAKDALGICVLGHGAMKGRVPGRVISSWHFRQSFDSR